MVLLNSLEGGTHGVTVSTANSGGLSGDSFTIESTSGSGAICTFDSSTFAHGAMCFLTSTGVTSVASYVGWSLPNLTTDYGKAYVQAQAFPAAQRPMIAYRTGAAGATQALRFSMNSTGNIEVRNAANTNVGQTVAAITLFQWFRLEWRVVFSTTVGVVELQLFLSPDSITPTETLLLTGLALGADASQIRFGVPSSQASAPIVLMDEVGAGGLTWLGPTEDPLPPESGFISISRTSPMRPDFPMNGLPPDEVLDALTRGIVRVRRRVEIYESDAVTPFDITRWNYRLSTGSITVDRDRDERRMCDLLLENKDNALQVSSDGFWYDKILKAYWGVLYNDTNLGTQLWETQIGEFMIDRIDEARFPYMVKVTGRDYTKKCLNSKIPFSLEFPQGTAVETIIRALAANAGVTKFALPYTGLSFSRDIVFPQLTPRWDVMKQVADSIGFEVFFRGDGFLTMQPYPDPVTSPLAWIFSGGQGDGTLVDWSRSTNDSRVKNHVIVTGTTDSDELGFNRTIFSELINTDPNSPTRVSRIGDRVDSFESEFITTQEQADEIARQRMRIASLEEYDMNFSSIVLPWIDASTIVDILDPRAASTTPQRFLLSNLNLNLGLGPMSGVGRRVTITGTDQSLEYV